MRANMTMKKFLKAYFERDKILLPDYLYSVFTNRAVVISFCIAFGAAFCIAVFRMVSVFAYLAWGPIAVPSATSPIGYLAWVFLGGVAGFFITEIKAMRRFFATKTEKESADAPAVSAKPPNLDPLTFDANKGILSYHGKTCAIPLKRYQHIVCMKLFEHPGERVNDRDILIAIDWAKEARDSERLVRDAVRAICIKAKTNLGIENALVWESLTAWVNDEYLA